MFGSRKSKDANGAAAVKAAANSAQEVIKPVANGAAPYSVAGHAAAPGDASNLLEAQRAAVAVRQSVAFAQIVSVLMRSPHYKHYTLSDLEWLVLPPLVTGQFSIAEASAQQNGPRFPAAVALWASVSPEVDKRLAGNLAAPMRLRPDEWRCGDTLWLVDAVGDPRVVPELLKRLRGSVFAQKELKVRTRGPDGKPMVDTLRSAPAA